MIYIVVHDIGAYSDREVQNEGVFATKTEAVNYVHNKGYTKHEEDNYLKPEDNALNSEDCYLIEEWEIYREKEAPNDYSHIQPKIQ